jgi:hypothetical protein
MGELVSADISSLGESLMADFTLEGFFPRVSPLMGLRNVSFCVHGAAAAAYLQVALLRETLSA